MPLWPLWFYFKIGRTQGNDPPRRLSLVFSSVLTMAKIRAQKWQHTGKALTLQTRTQTKQCWVHTREYSAPLDCRSILKKWFWLLVTLATATKAQRARPQGTVLWPEEKKRDDIPAEVKGKIYSQILTILFSKSLGLCFYCVSFRNTIMELQNTVPDGKLYEKPDPANILAHA